MSFHGARTVGETNTNNSERDHTLNINNAGSPRCYPEPPLQFVSPVLKDKQVQRAEPGAGRRNARVALVILDLLFTRNLIQFEL